MADAKPPTRQRVREYLLPAALSRLRFRGRLRFHLNDVVVEIQEVAPAESSLKGPKELKRDVSDLLAGLKGRKRPASGGPAGERWLEADGEFTKIELVPDGRLLVAGSRRDEEGFEWEFHFVATFSDYEGQLPTLMPVRASTLVLVTRASAVIAGAHWCMVKGLETRVIGVPLLPAVRVHADRAEEPLPSVQFVSPIRKGLEGRELTAVSRLLLHMKHEDTLESTGCLALLKGYEQSLVASGHKEAQGLSDILRKRLTSGLANLDLRVGIDVPAHRSFGTSGAASVAISWLMIRASNSVAPYLWVFPTDQGTGGDAGAGSTGTHVTLDSFLGSGASSRRNLELLVLAHVLETLLHSDVGGLNRRAIGRLRGVSSGASVVSCLMGRPVQVSLDETGCIDVMRTHVLCSSWRVPFTGFLKLDTRPRSTSGSLLSFHSFLSTFREPTHFRPFAEASNSVTDDMWFAIQAASLPGADTRRVQDLQRIVTQLVYPMVPASHLEEVARIREDLDVETSPVGDGQQGLFLFCASSAEDMNRLRDKTRLRASESDLRPHVVAPLLGRPFAAPGVLFISSPAERLTTGLV